MDSGQKEETDFLSFLFYDAVIQRVVFLLLFSFCVSIDTLTPEYRLLKYSETVLNRVKVPNGSVHLSSLCFYRKPLHFIQRMSFAVLITFP